MDKLGINLNLLIVQAINFGILATVLYMLLYKRVQNMLRERTERIEQSLRDAEQVKVQLANAKRDYDAELARARSDAAGIVAQAQERARAQEAELIAKANTDAQRIRSEAAAQIDQERERMLREVRAQLADMVTLAAGRVLKAEIDPKRHSQLIDETLASLTQRN